MFQAPALCWGWRACSCFYVWVSLVLVWVIALACAVFGSWQQFGLRCVSISFRSCILTNSFACALLLYLSHCFCLNDIHACLHQSYSVDLRSFGGHPRFRPCSWQLLWYQVRRHVAALSHLSRSAIMPMYRLYFVVCHHLASTLYHSSSTAPPRTREKYVHQNGFHLSYEHLVRWMP